MSRNLDYLRADAHRAEQQGRREMTVQTADILEAMALIESLKAKAEVQFGGRRIGFCKPEAVKGMQLGQKFFISIRRRKNEDFTVAVSVVPADETMGDSPNNQEGKQTL